MTERFAVADQLTCYYDRPAEPANVHLEVRVPGRLDEGALRDSVRAVLAAEPRIRARRAGGGRWRPSYYWDFPDRPDADPLRAAVHGDQPELDAQRDEFVSQAVPLDISPPMRFLLTAGPAGDSLLLNAHHACFDGLSCLRLLREVAGEYGVRAARGAAAPAARAGLARRPAGQAGAVAFAGRPGHLAAPSREAAAARAAGPRRGATARIAPGDGGRARRALPGYGALVMAWDGLAAADSLRSAGASVNDLLIAALMLTVGDWNSSRGARCGLVTITMPVGDRAQAGGDGQWANLSRLAAVSAAWPSLADPARLLADVARQAGQAKDHGGPQVGLAFRVLAAAPVPVALKHAALRAALAVAGPLLCDTSLVSNLGAIEAPAFGDLAADEVWFSTSAHMPRGLSLGAVTAGGRLRLTFRYRRALFGAADAAEFARRYAKALDSLTAIRAPRNGAGDSS